MKNYLISFSVLFLFNLTLFAQNSKREAKEEKKKEQYEKILTLVQSGNYEFVGRKANPQNGRQVDLTTRSNYLRISGENSSADMPYFGRAYSGGYSSSDGGIKFDGLMENYVVDENDKKRSLTIKFKAKGSDDNYNCTLIISGMESASLSISSNKRQVIRYTGLVQKLSVGE